MTLGASSMNGTTAHPPQHQQQAQQMQQPAFDQSALGVLPPLVITPALVVSVVKWISGAVVGVVAILSASNGFERYMLPAKDSELKLWVDVVKGVQQAQTEQKQSMDRLTMAVDNLAGIVAEVRQASQAIKNAAPKLKAR